MQSMTMARWLGIVVAGVAGITALAAAYATGLPGDGTFLVVAAVAGLVAGLAAPTWLGFVVLVGAVALPVTIQASTYEFAGLWALVIGSIVVPATAGWLVGAAIRRAARLGLRAAVTDPRVVGALVGVALIVAFVAYMAASFATDPP
jgi:hypothetical protein